MDARTQRAVQGAERAAAYAKETREELRWGSTPGDTTRERALKKAIERLDRAMKPIRSYVGKLSWDPQPIEVETALMRASKACQYERRQLKKMRRP